ncbi:hypothetical protein D9M70_635150 [compost metagenome]
MMSAPLIAQVGASQLAAGVLEIDLDEAASLVEQAEEENVLDFGATRLVVMESPGTGRFAVLTTASGRCAQILLR